MFERPHHLRIAKLLQFFNAELLQDAKCYFGGGTAIVLSLGEYRESIDVDFLCSSKEGFRVLRNTVTMQSLGALLREPVPHRRDVRSERDKIATFLDVDGAPVKVEFLLEGNLEISGSFDPVFQVPTLSREDMYATKLLANADRGLDKSTLSRDIIDLAMMIDHWGDIPESAWTKAKAAYGGHVVRAYHRSCELICDQTYLIGCLRKMHMEEGLVERLPEVLECSPRLDADDHDSAWKP
ncbi:nucleotidyl transferase AbiEii/AbiGii toxin family protein [Lysobacter pythonis]|uniref:Nucleotidyl transferase AbiEii/AbiGii toxin family protein n=1 Tax=Solilutibacter pythonis TaxID=2483112 RepID=A0A3M2I039_9GAMM|nr:nucleotidyl transferase AbiEii/AbiGii toxin family protein [Lysobacter pythonis]RMH92999.1 nucleotidyl transferase AbiEii/AbiGii toxin family protein [Lysobacter pythonis]